MATASGSMVLSRGNTEDLDKMYDTWLGARAEHRADAEGPRPRGTAKFGLRTYRLDSDVNSDAKPVRPKAWLAWSSGKDSAWTLHVVRERGELDVVALLTTVNRTHNRVAMHAVRESLLEAQAEAAGLPLVVVRSPGPAPTKNTNERWPQP